MTDFDLRSLRLHPGDERAVEKEIALLGFDLGGQAYVPAPDCVTVALKVAQTVSGAVLHLRFDAHLAGPCVRCLAPAMLDLHILAHEYQDSKPVPGDDLSTVYVEDDILDLSQWARDEVALALPEQILCRPDCAGLCPACGKDLNLEPHVHEQSVADLRWQALADLRDELTP